jgi:hypothetical protein
LRISSEERVFRRRSRHRRDEAGRRLLDVRQRPRPLGISRVQPRTAFLLACRRIGAIRDVRRASPGYAVTAAAPPQRQRSSLERQHTPFCRRDIPAGRSSWRRSATPRTDSNRMARSNRSRRVARHNRTPSSAAENDIPCKFCGRPVETRYSFIRARNCPCHVSISGHFTQ